ncbi:MAG: hypothetical protein GY770_14530 [Aestuariibacter sp.]|nr:hypothetical protein [Aestuariibacter sp.]
MANITLKIEDDVIKKVRKIAIDKNTTMTAMIRTYLQSVAERETTARERRIAVLEQNFSKLGRDMGEHSWAREDLYG